MGAARAQNGRQVLLLRNTLAKDCCSDLPFWLLQVVLHFWWAHKCSLGQRAEKTGAASITEGGWQWQTLLRDQDERGDDATNCKGPLDVSKPYVKCQNKAKHGDVK